MCGQPMDMVGWQWKAAGGTICVHYLGQAQTAIQVQPTAAVVRQQHTRVNEQNQNQKQLEIKVFPQPQCKLNFSFRKIQTVYTESQISSFTTQYCRAHASNAEHTSIDPCLEQTWMAEHHGSEAAE